MHLRRVVILAASAAFVLLAATTPSLATTPGGGALVCSAANDQNAPAILSDGVGGAFIAWVDTRSGTSDIYLQRVDSTGTALWDPNGIPVCVAPGSQASIAIAPAVGGGVWLAWVDSRNGTSDIYARTVSASGFAGGVTNGNPVCTATNTQTSPSIITDGASGVILCWLDARGGAGNNVYAQRLSLAGIAQWTLNGVQLTNTGTQTDLKMTADGSGGGILVWSDSRGGAGAFDVYAQKVSSTGTPSWAANGVVISNQAGNQGSCQIVGDLSSGAIMTWMTGTSSATNTVFAQRVNASGAPLWTANGVALSVNPGQNNPQIIPTSASGCIIAWAGPATTIPLEYFGQRLNSSGVAQWFPNGQVFTTSNGIPSSSGPVIASDGADGMYAAWLDSRLGAANVFVTQVTSGGGQNWDVTGGNQVSGSAGGASGVAIAPGFGNTGLIAWSDRRYSSNDVYVQKNNLTGSLRLADRDAPLLNPVKDVANDQGGAVRLTWRASGFDAPGSEAVTSYRVWRRVPASSPATAIRLAERARLMPEQWRTRVEAAQVTYWEALATVAAGQLPAYAYVAPTLSDSIAAGNPFTAFFVTALTESTFKFYDSNVDSGYSVDNLPPVQPAPFTATYGGGSTALHWGANGEADLSGYRVHRGGSPGFTPDAGNQIAATSDTGTVDPTAGAFYYKLTAIDVHGNHSPYATAQPSGTTGVDPAAGRGVWLGRATPNPVRGATRIPFALPRATAVRLAVYDATGRCVRTLIDGVVPAGEGSAEWDGRGASGHALAGGLYFYRLDVAGQTLRGRLALIR